MKIQIKSSSKQNKANLVLRKLNPNNKKNFMKTYKMHQVLINLLLIELLQKINSKV